MSLLSSLYTGVSGLQSFGNSLQVVGDNIANVSTIGFKGSRAEFAALLSQSVSGVGGVSQIGRGVALQRVTPSFSQGSFTSTDRLTDLGINGSGFFVLSDGANHFYTRNGQFSVDKNGFLVNSTGLRVQGNRFDPNGVSQGQGDLVLDSVNAAPQATSAGGAGGVAINANLDSTATIPAAFDPTSSLTAQQTSNFSTTISVYDSLGHSHSVTVYMRKQVEADPGAVVPVPNSTWQWFASVDGAEINNAAATPGTPFVGASGTVTFDTDGNMTGQTTTASDFDFSGGATLNQAINFDFTGTTQFATPNTVRSQSQNGFSDGSLTSVAIGDDGTITGSFSNGQSRAIGQLVLANFANPQGLSPGGNSLFKETIDSGVPVVGDPKSGGLGSIASFTLEQSNVDLADEFVNLVTMQRAFQANSKIITTVDQLLNEVVNIIR